MSAPTPVKDFLCPFCDAPLQDHWYACPACGNRVKPSDDMLLRSVLWMFLLLAFVSSTLLIFRSDRQAALTFGLLFGIPLVYLFGKAVLFRVRGRPLSWKDLGWTSFRVAVVGLFLTVVLPILIGLAFIIFLFAVCGLMIVGGR